MTKRWFSITEKTRSRRKSSFPLRKLAERMIMLVNGIWKSEELIKDEVNTRKVVSLSESFSSKQIQLLAANALSNKMIMRMSSNFQLFTKVRDPSR